ncbi:MAG: SDR family NAD(P)-dependent oxidoreductase [Rhodocyclaceae bacterium]|nr:SDR family NAD(P)-dependent oxidoreductase [Pseudomonadota bacterium]MDQ7971106.1 SDR family NAD(P)-dependent oxidoreductase [Rhodocyclaceae bacterium]MDQ7998354.1 SDR family NAD(P)-dependent oxidoreductase [Pseudomonadota bacterium]MDQ8015811.1 SDR family NAD(P)-dependent oxidoreductase [Pseudomonadota bacterium]
MSKATTSTLQGQVAIVTGAARGLGRAYALRLAQLGADVVVADIDLASAREFGESLTAPGVPEEIRALGRRSLGVEGDLRRRAGARALVQRTLAELGRIDILVNNAGGAFTPVERSLASQMPDEDTDAMLDVNYRSALFCSQEVLPTMRAQGGGVIVNIATLAALDPSRAAGRLAPYAIAKGAVTTLTRYLAQELGPQGIRVNCIAPGSMMTERIRKQAAERGMQNEKELKRIPLRRFGEVEDCANVLEFLVTPLSGYVTGQCISVCGGQVLTPS